MNRKGILCGIILVVLVLLLPVIYHEVKGWRAKGFLSKSCDAFAAGDFQGGLSLLRQANALAPGSEEVQHAVELYNARAGDVNSLQSLLKQMRARSLQTRELLGVAEIEANSARQNEAAEALSLLPKNLGAKDALQRTLIESRLLANENKIEQAASLCLYSADLLERGDSDFLKIQAARYLLSMNDPSAAKQAARILQKVAGNGTEASIQAWRMEVGRLKAAGNAANSKEEIGQLVKLLPLLSGALVQDQLLASEMEIQADPTCEHEVISKLTIRYQNADRSVMLALARWLNTRGYHAEAIAFAGDDRPRSDTDWLLVVLDAKSSLGRWSDVTAMLNSSASAGIPDAVRYLFLARCAMMRGDRAATDDAWSGVTASLPLEKPETLAYVAGYEEQIGALDEAMHTYREMASREQTRRAGLSALIRIQSSTAPASTMIPLYEELMAEDPDYADAEGDLDYLKLLTNEDVSKVAADAERLLKAQPGSLARISVAALGRFRLGDTKGAMMLYEAKSIDWSAAPVPWRIVRTVVLRSTGDVSGADKMAAGIDARNLRPEELVLLKEGKAQVNP